MKKLVIALFAMFTITSYSQIDLESIFEGGSDAASSYLRGYLEPIGIGFGNAINGGWYNTAKTHKLFGIDIAVIASGALVPEEGETFTFNSTPSISFEDGSASGQLPSIFGSQSLDDRPLLTFNDGNGNSLSASALPGVGLDQAIGVNAVPAPMVQAGIGLIKNTDVMIRFIPEQTADEYEFSTFGFGIKHDIKQWIPFVKKLPFDVSILAAWNNMKSKVFFDSENNPSQAVQLNTRTSIYQLIASKKLAIFTLYGGLGTTSYSTDLNILGEFVTNNNPVTNPLVDPVQLNYEGNSFRSNIGLRVKLLFLDIAAEYALQEYDVVTLRVGFSVR